MNSEIIRTLFLPIALAIIIFVVYIKFFPKKIIEKFIKNKYFWWSLGVIVFLNTRPKGSHIGDPTRGELILA